MKDVLIVSYHFPPYGGGAVSRIHSFAKYFPSYGFRPVVLTVEERYYGQAFLDESLAAEYTTPIEVVRTRSLEPGGRRVKDQVFGGTKPSRRDTLKLTVLRWAQRHLLIPDRCVLWRPYALRAGKRIVWKRRPQAILASIPAATNATVARALAAKTSIPLIVDFRDMWTTNPFYRAASRLRGRIERSMEKRCVSQAAAVLATTEEATEQLRALYPSRAKYILHFPNGFDPEKFGGRVRRRTPGAPVRFAYTGALTMNRSPEYFLRAVARAIEESPHLRRGIEIRFFGFTAANHRDAIGRLGLGDVARVCDFMSAGETARILQEETDVALLFQRAADGGETAIPGKLYEYLASGCVVLAMCDGGATVNLLKTLGVGLLTPYEDEAAIARAIVRATEIVEQNPTAHVLPASVLSRFDRRAICGRLAELIDRLGESNVSP